MRISFLLACSIIYFALAVTRATWVLSSPVEHQIFSKGEPECEAKP